jgi:hypothetical protein
MKSFRLAAIACSSLLLAATLCGDLTGQQERGSSSKDKDLKLIKPEEVIGCYELGVLEWKPDLRLGEDLEFITPPTRIQLFAEHDTDGFDREAYVARPASGVSRSVHRDSYWKPKGPKSIEISWTTGFSGLTMGLTVERNSLQGTAFSFWDFGRKRQTAHVSAPKVDCEAKL